MRRLYPHVCTIMIIYAKRIRRVLVVHDHKYKVSKWYTRYNGFGSWSGEGTYKICYRFINFLRKDYNIINIVNVLLE